MGKRARGESNAGRRAVATASTTAPMPSSARRTSTKGSERKMRANAGANGEAGASPRESLNGRARGRVRRARAARSKRVPPPAVRG